MTGPHVDQLDRDQIDDHGLVDDDNTEDLRPPTKKAPGWCCHTAEGQNNHVHITEQELWP